MKVYIAGPMRGLPNWNLGAFAEAEQRFREARHHVFSPAALVLAMGYSLDHPAEPGEGTEHLRHVMLSDIACIFAADAIALLPGWERSRGSTVELALAQFMGLKVFDAVAMEEIHPDLCPWGHKQSVEDRTSSHSRNSELRR